MLHKLDSLLSEALDTAQAVIDGGHYDAETCERMVAVTRLLAEALAVADEGN